MPIGVPVSTPPAQAALDAVLQGATRAELVVGGERARILGPADLRALGAAVRLADAPPRWVGRDLPGNVEVGLWQGGEDLGLLIVNPYLTIRWIDWSAACDVADPAALGRWLSERGSPGPLAALAVRAAPDAAERRARFLSLAPAALRPRLAGLESDPYAFDIPTYREAFDALAGALGGSGPAIWAVCAWHGATPGPWDRAPPVERLADGLLRSVGVEDILDLAARGVPEAARAGLCRFLVDNACTRYWALPTRLSEAERTALVRAAAASDARNEPRARQVLVSEGPLAPEGTRLLAAAQNGSFRRACTDGRSAFVMDGRSICRVDAPGEVRELFEAYRPGSPLAVRGGHVWFLNPVDPVSVPVSGGERRDRRGLLSGFREVRFPWSYRRFREACDRAVERAMPGADPGLVLDAERDEREAYVAFGGDLPAAMESSHFWACDPAGRRLLRISRKGEGQAIDVAGEPVAIGARGDRVHVVVAHDDGSISVAVVAGRELAARTSPRCFVSADRVRGVLLVGDDVWLRLSAPLGDVLVTLGALGRA